MKMPTAIVWQTVPPRIWLILNLLGHQNLAQQRNCPVRIFSNALMESERSANGPIETANNLWHSSETLMDSQLGQIGSTLKPWPNNTAILFSEHYEPDSESSLTSNFKCQFIFVGAPDERVQIIFNYFHLRQLPHQRISQNSTVRCEESDYLSAHVLLADRMSKIQDFCGDELPAQLMSAKNVLTLTYVLKSALTNVLPMAAQQRQQQMKNLHKMENSGEEMDENNGRKENAHFGWIAEYRFIRDFGVQPDEAQVTAAYEPLISLPIEKEQMFMTNQKDCSFIFNGSVKATGNVWSPNYPGFYPRNVDCQYVFIGREGQQVYITFEYFDVEGFGHCEVTTQSDYLLFSNYKTRDRTNRRFCGFLKPKGAVQSESNYFRMHFHTNSIFDGTGFYARYQFLDRKTLKSRVKLAPSGSDAEMASANALSLLLLFIFLHFIFGIL